MKSQLDARPIYLQKEETIAGHFLICYLAVLLTRILQFKILGNGDEMSIDFSGLSKAQAAALHTHRASITRLAGCIPAA